MIPIQRLSIEELEALELCVDGFGEEFGSKSKDVLLAKSALVKLRAVVPLPHRAGTAGDVMCCVERVDQDDYSLPPCAKDAPEVPR